ncbi:MAG: hypothetical protein ACE5OP_07260 [Candidatus Glassbacteria bacterium]
MGAAVNDGPGIAYGSYGIATNTGSSFAYGAWGHGKVENDVGWAYGVHGMGENTSSGLAFGGLFSTVDIGTGAHYGVQALSFGTNSSPMVGVHGFGQNNSDGDAYGGFFEAPSFGTGTHYGIWSDAQGASSLPSYGTYSNAGNSGSGTVYAEGDQIASGTKSAVVRTASSGHRLMYTIESSEVWFEDIGEGRLAGGRARIEIDPLFLETVTIDEKNPMQVFVQLTSGEPMPTVVERGFDGFEVRVSDRESDASFSYRVMAKRKGYEEERIRETDVGYEDPNLYQELLPEIERKHEEESRRQELQRRRMEEQRQQIQEQERRMEQARLGEVR